MSAAPRRQTENDSRAEKLNALRLDGSPGTDALLGDMSSWSRVTLSSC
jgi:hypothetical protein